MTGFGRSNGAMSSRYAVAVTVKSVNHRFLEVGVRLPEFLWELEAAVRASVGEAFARGKVDVVIRTQRTVQPDYSVRINTQIANTVVPQLKSIAEELGLGSTFSGSDLLRVPDLLHVEAIETEITDEERDALQRIVREALAAAQTMRNREGEMLKTDISSRLATIRDLHQRVAQLRDDVRVELLNTFRTRVQEIAASAGIEVAEERIAQEVVMMIEKGDIAEEITRLAHHVEEASRAIDGKEAAGKKLDFLSQEMLREINTMGSKSRSAALRTVVVELKTEVERIREQVQNVE